MSDLVCCMLESLSSLEDQSLNYVEVWLNDIFNSCTNSPLILVYSYVNFLCFSFYQLHAANVGIQSEKLESLRISIAKGSPMWETLDSCIKVVDAESLNTLIPRLAHLVRSGVGLNTRSFINLLSHFMHFLLHCLLAWTVLSPFVISFSLENLRSLCWFK